VRRAICRSTRFRSSPAARSRSACASTAAWTTPASASSSTLHLSLRIGGGESLAPRDGRSSSNHRPQGAWNIMDTENDQRITGSDDLMRTNLGPLRAVRPDGDTSEVQFSNFVVDMTVGLSTRMRLFYPDSISPLQIETETAPAGVAHTPVIPYPSDLNSVHFNKIVVTVGGYSHCFYPTPSGEWDPRAGVEVDLSKGLETSITVHPGTTASSPMGPGFVLTLTQADPPAGS
jgi:hypothetical protein